MPTGCKASYSIIASATSWRKIGKMINKLNATNHRQHRFSFLVGFCRYKFLFKKIKSQVFVYWHGICRTLVHTFLTPHDKLCNPACQNEANHIALSCL
jgi:hypothetical protein